MSPFPPAVAYYQSLVIAVERVMTDNGSCYKSHDFRDACKDLGLKHIRTRPYTPKTNGKAERFIQTALREWAYARAYPNSDQRAVELLLWLHRYNWHRPHGSLKYITPISRLRLTEDNLLRLHTQPVLAMVAVGEPIPMVLDIESAHVHCALLSVIRFSDGQHRDDWRETARDDPILQSLVLRVAVTQRRVVQHGAGCRRAAQSTVEHEIVLFDANNGDK